MELPYLVSCAMHLLDRRFWILGVRLPLGRIRYDLVVKYAWTKDHVVLVEAKYRGDGRPVRPYEVERFHAELEEARKHLGSHVYGLFMTNTRFSEKALQRLREHGIRALPNMPLLFHLARGAGEGGGDDSGGASSS